MNLCQKLSQKHEKSISNCNIDIPISNIKQKNCKIAQISQPTIPE